MATTKKKKKKESTRLPEKGCTLLQAIERVVELSKNSKMSDEFMLEAAPEISLLANSYGITERQAVLFCICMEKGPRRVDYDDLASHLDMNKISVLSYAADIDALVRRRLLKFRDVKDEDDFDIPTAVIRCLKHNEVYELPRRTGLDCAELFELLDQWFEDLNDDAISATELQEEMRTLFDDNKQIGFVSKLRDYNLTNQEETMVAFFCHCLVNDDDNDIRFGQLEDLFDTKAYFNKAKANLLPPSGEIQSAASDKISHSRVCYANFAAKVIIFFVNLSPIAQILLLYARFCLRLRPQPLNLTSSCRTSWQPEADSR